MWLDCNFYSNSMLAVLAENGARSQNLDFWEAESWQMDFLLAPASMPIGCTSEDDRNYGPVHREDTWWGKADIAYLILQWIPGSICALPPPPVISCWDKEHPFFLI